MSRPLHAVFTELLNDDAARQAYAADPSGFLEGTGYAGLPDELVAEAIISFADTANPAVAEHLAPFVQTYGPVPDAAEPGDSAEPAALDGLNLMATAPAGGDDADRDEPTDLVDPTAATGAAALGEPAGVVDDLDFGTGAELEPTEAPAAGFDDMLTEVPAADSEPAAPALMDDEPLLAPDPALEVDTEPEDDVDTE